MTALSARAHLVDDTNRFEESYLGRLRTYLPESADNVAKPPALTRAPRGRIRSIFALIPRVMKVARLTPSYAAQYRRLSRMRSERPSATQLIVSLASNRIGLHDGVRPRRNLALLLQPLGGVGSNALSRKINESDCLLVLDALPKSALWPHRDRCWDENVFIIDGGFLAFLFLLGALSEIGRHLRSVRDCLSHRQRSVEIHRPSIALTILAALISSTFDSFMRASRQHEAILLTSHSILTELVRAALIEDPRCSRIVEVMHGIGSIPAEAFSAAVLAAGQPFGSYQKHFYIPQIPDLPLAGVFKRQMLNEGEGAINAYLNRYFIKRLPRTVDSVMSEVRALVDSAPVDPIVVTIFGYAPSDGSLMHSPTFGAECLLFGLITSIKSQLSSGCIFVYVPHPVHASATFDDPSFMENGVRICRESTVAWLVSDICISLASSAMFEGAYFGARGFTTLLPVDGVFTADYLAMLARPASPSLEDLTDAVRRLMADYRRPTNTVVIERARQRLALMIADDSQATFAMSASA